MINTHIQTVKGNDECIHCWTAEPEWASVNNGIFLCMSCAAKHRNMGTHISFVRSISLDSWSEMQLNRMKYGGNERLKQFWKDQKFPMGLTTEQKLDNKAMDKYRENLLNLAKNGEKVEPISFIGYHKQNVVQNKLDDKIMTGFGNS